jgi:CelD/BcsL family acetyltransferase involved in cellulose biosynthesis
MPPASSTSDGTVVRDAADLTQLWRPWDELAATPMQHSAWLRAWLASFQAAYDPCVVVVGPIERPRAIAPLAVPRAGSGRLEWMSVRELGEPVGALSNGDPQSVAELGHALIELGEPLLLQRLRAHSALASALRSQASRRAIVYERPSNPYSYVDLDLSWAEPEAHVSTSRRKDLRRKRRAAEKLGPLVFEEFKATPRDVDSLLDEALRIEASGWKGRAGTALVHDRERAAFYRVYLRHAAVGGFVRIFFLRIGDRRVAMQVHAEFAKRLWQIKVGYDDAFARVSPGMLLTLEIIGAAAREGLEGLEFLGSVEPWTSTWSPSLRTFATVRVYPIGAMHSLAALCTDAREAWQSARVMAAASRLRPGLRERRRVHDLEVRAS